MRNKRKHKFNFSLNPKYVFRILIVACIMLMFISFRYEDKFSTVKNAIGDFISPMQSGINTVGRYITAKLDLMKDIEELAAENDELRTQIEELKIANNSLAMEKYELNSLRELYNVGKKYADYEKIAAHVISKDSNNYYSVFTIDKGSEDGIKKDMNVIAGNGLVGIVTEVGKNYAKVRSIIDDTSYVSGMFINTTDTCDVKGNLELLDTGYIKIEAINLDAVVGEGFEVVTSHISDKYLQGILIGYAYNIEVDSSGMTKQAYLKPVVDFEHLEDVLVITTLKEELAEDAVIVTYGDVYKDSQKLTAEEKEKLARELLKQAEAEKAEQETEVE